MIRVNNQKITSTGGLCQFNSYILYSPIYSISGLQYTRVFYIQLTLSIRMQIIIGPVRPLASSVKNPLKSKRLPLTLHQQKEPSSCTTAQLACRHHSSQKILGVLAERRTRKRRQRWQASAKDVRLKEDEKDKRPGVPHRRRLYTNNNLKQPSPDGATQPET